MDDAIRAMTCLMIDPELHGMLIKGPSGSGKSSLIHSFSGAITGKRARVIPLNITDEQLFGCINIEKALTTGTIELEKGILGEDGQIILVDDVNLLPRNTSLQIMESVQRGTVSVEREGLSTTYRCNMNVVATANDREQPLSPSLSDLFDICVIIPRDPDRYKRVDVMNASIATPSASHRDGAVGSGYPNRWGSFGKNRECQENRREGDDP